MYHGVIGLIAAMPEEIRPILRLAGKVKKEQLDEFEAYGFTLGKEKVLLVKSGMGPANAAAAANLLIKKAKPSIIINFGFCGAVTSETKVGDIVVAQRILLNRGNLFSPQSGISEEVAKRLCRSLVDAMNGRGFSVLGGTFITSSEIRSKGEIACQVPAWAPNPVLEMETAAVAKAAAQEEVPLVALRAVSDGAEEELGFSITEFTDSKMEVKMGKVLLTVARKPRIIPQLLRLAEGSKKAGENLMLAIASLLEEADELPLKRVTRF